MTQPLELFLFTCDPDLATRAVAAGVDGIVVDWERAGKHDRQASAGTEINADTIEDLCRIRAASGSRILCRINAVGDETADEVEAAVEAGADELLVPMVRCREDVQLAVDIARGRIEVGILVETVEAVEGAIELGELPISRVFVGLNDLAIERQSPSIFSALIDGTVEAVRAAFTAPFGVAGLTVPDAGDPLPCRLLMGELARLRCEYTFLRRSFRRDIVGRDLDVEVPRMREAVLQATNRSHEDVRDEHTELTRMIRELETSAAGHHLAISDLEERVQAGRDSA